MHLIVDIWWGGLIVSCELTLLILDTVVTSVIELTGRGCFRDEKCLKFMH